MTRLEEILMSDLGDIRLIIKNEYINGSVPRKYECIFGDGSYDIIGDRDRCQGCDDYEDINFDDYDDLKFLINNSCVPCHYSLSNKKVCFDKDDKLIFKTTVTHNQNKFNKIGLLDYMCTNKPIDFSFNKNEKSQAQDFRFCFIVKNEFREEFGDNYREKVLLNMLSEFSEEIENKKNIPNYVTNSSGELFFDVTEYLIIEEKNNSGVIKPKDQLVKEMYRMYLEFGVKPRKDGGIQHKENSYIFPDGTMKMLLKK